jgi:hypothetical protein
MLLGRRPNQFDDQDDGDGANKVSLKQGQKNFIEFGACEIEMIENVRPPGNDEQRDEDWKPLG